MQRQMFYQNRATAATAGKKGKGITSEQHTKRQEKEEMKQIEAGDAVVKKERMNTRTQTAKSRHKTGRRQTQSASLT